MSSLSQGFLFGFYWFDGHDETMYEYAFHEAAALLTGSSWVHCQCTPVLNFDPDGPLVVSSAAFTAFMGQQFQPYDVRESLCCSNYKFLYLPLSREATVQGLRELLALQNTPYAGFVKLLTAALPGAVTRHLRPVTGRVTTVFCSEACARVCRVCNVRSRRPPRCCSPGLVHDMLVAHRAAEIPARRVVVRDWKLHELWPELLPKSET